MKYLLSLIVIVISTSTFAFGQTKNTNTANNSVEAQLISLEKQAAEAFKEKNFNFFQSYLSNDVVGITPTGAVGKSEVIKLISSMDCKVNSVSMDSYKTKMLNKDTAVLTYKTTQDITCDGKKEPPIVWCWTLYVKDGGKWQAVFHQETAAVQ
jgi:hypothetical protein